MAPEHSKLQVVAFQRGFLDKMHGKIQNLFARRVSKKVAEQLKRRRRPNRRPLPAAAQTPFGAWYRAQPGWLWNLVWRFDLMASHLGKERFRNNKSQGS